jgi:hypothetical protein
MTPALALYCLMPRELSKCLRCQIQRYAVLSVVQRNRKDPLQRLESWKALSTPALR